MRVLSAALVAIVLFSAAGCSKSGPASEFAGGDADKQKYTFVLTSPERIGNRFRANFSTGHNTEVLMQVGDRTLQEQRLSAKLDAVADLAIVAVDSKGEPTGVRSTVVSSTAMLDGRSVGAIPAGTVLESRKVTGDEKLTGLPFALDPEISRMAENTFSGSDPEKPTDQEIFGTDQPQAIGDRWNINAENFRRKISTPDVDLATATLDGYATLIELIKIDGIECYHVRAVVTVRGVRVDMPAQVTLEKSDGTLTFDTYVPVTGGYETKEEGVFDIEMKANGPNGVKLTQQTTQSYSIAFSRAAAAN